MAALWLPPPSPSLLLRSSPSFAPNPNPRRTSRCARKSTATGAAAAAAVAVGAKYAVLGAGFAGLSVAWHLLKHCPKESHISIDIYDEAGIGGGASGVSGGLLHPYSPKAKLLWRGAECWRECLKLVKIADAAAQARNPENTGQGSPCHSEGPIILRRGILRPITTMKNVEMLKENAQNCIKDCTLQVLNGDAVHNLVPHLSLPFDSAIYMPAAVNVHPKRYLEALFLACQGIQDAASASGNNPREIKLHQRSINSLCQLAGEYSAVIVCLGAKSTMLPELSEKLPLRLCRGVISQLQLQTGNMNEEIATHSPSILSDAWLAFQGPHTVLMGSTWDWHSKNFSSYVSSDESSKAYEELLPKASMVYPAIKRWELVGAQAGLRAMAPLTPLGSLPLLGCVDEYVADKGRSKYWLVGGLGSRGLVYHGLLGRLMAGAVLSSDEAALPGELTSWKNNVRK